MKSIHQASNRVFLSLLVQARETAGMTQQQLADKLERPQSFVSKVENGERRLDVIEFLEFCRLLKADPCEILRAIPNQQRRR